MGKYTREPFIAGDVVDEVVMNNLLDAANTAHDEAESAIDTANQALTAAQEPVVLPDGSVTEAKLSKELAAKVNTVADGSGVAPSELYDVLVSVPPELVTTRYSGQIWNATGVLASSTTLSATNKINTSANAVFAVRGVTGSLGNTQIGRFFRTDGTVHSNITSAHFTVIVGGHRLTTPNDVAITSFALNVNTADINSLFIQAGGSVITEEVKQVKPTLIPVLSQLSNDINFIAGSAVLEVNPNLAVGTPGYIWSTTGVLSVSASFWAFAKLPATPNAEFAVQGLSTAPNTGTNTGRFLRADGTVHSTINGDYFAAIHGGYKLIVPNDATITQVALYFNATDSPNIKIYAGGAIPKTEVKTSVLPVTVSSDAKALRFYEQGRVIKPSTSLMPGYILAGQSNQAGRIELSELPQWWIDNGNKITDVQNINTNDGVWHEYNATNYDNPSGTSYWSYELLLLKKLIDYQKTQTGRSADKIYTVKRAVGGTSIAHDGAGAGRWTPEFELIPTNTEKLLSTLEDRVRTAKASGNGSLYEMRGMIWHQGESDNNRSDKYYQNLKNLIYYVRGFTSNPKLAIVLGGINNKSLQYNGTVEDAKIKLAAEDNFIFYAPVSNTLTTLKTDKLHFNAAGGEELATTIYNIMIANKAVFGLA